MIGHSKSSGKGRRYSRSNSGPTNEQRRSDIGRHSAAWGVAGGRRVKLGSLTPGRSFTGAWALAESKWPRHGANEAASEYLTGGRTATLASAKNTWPAASRLSTELIVGRHTASEPRVIEQRVELREALTSSGDLMALAALLLAEASAGCGASSKPRVFEPITTFVGVLAWPRSSASAANSTTSRLVAA